MRDPARIPQILEALRIEWSCHPDLRFCQLVHNITHHESPVGIVYRDIHSVEDTEFASSLESYRKRMGSNAPPKG